MNTADFALGLSLLVGLLGLVAVGLAAAALVRIAKLENQIRKLNFYQPRQPPEALASKIAEKRQQLRTTQDASVAEPPPSLAEPDAPAQHAGQGLTFTEDSPTAELVERAQAEPGQGPTPPLPPSVSPDTPSKISKPPAMAFNAKAARPAALEKDPFAKVNFEQFMGTKMLVWLGGLALALACGFFVHHAFSNNWVTPEIRILGGAAFGLCMLGVADWVKQKANVVAQACSGSGISSLYAVIFAASHYYDFISSPTDFFLSVAVTCIAVVLALRHGPFTAILGLLGGFTMPILLRTSEPAGTVFFGYLILLQLALVALGRYRGWWWLSGLSLVVAALWGIASACGLMPITHRALPEVLFLGMAAVYVFGSLPRKGDEGKTTPAWLGVAGMSTSLLLMIVHVGFGRYEPRGMAMLGVIAAGTLVLGRFDKRYMRLPWAALAAVIGMLMTYAVWGDMEASPGDGFVMRFSIAAIGYWVVLGLGAWACTWRSDKVADWAVLSVSTGAMVLAVSMTGLWRWVDDDFAWWAVVAGLGAVYLLMGVLRYVALSKPEGEPGRDVAVNVWVGLTTVLVGFAIGLAGHDDMPWMRIGWAALAGAIVFAYFRFGVTCLRVLAVIVVSLVGVCAVIPGPFFEPIAEAVLLNELLLAYGLSAALLAVVAWWSHRQGDSPLCDVALCVVSAIVTLGSAVMIHNGFCADDWTEPATMIEWASHTMSWQLLGLIAWWLGVCWHQRVLLIAGVMIGCLGVMVAVLGPGLLMNPMQHRESVGSAMIFNWLLYIYLLPVVLSLAHAQLIKRRGELIPESVKRGPRVLGVCCLLLLFAWVSLCVRQGFAGTVLDVGLTKITPAESYAYSMAWVGLGVFLLVVGIVSGSVSARWGSLAVMMLAVFKVFIIDAAALRDLYRVLSFLGLGVCLIGLGYVYQRFVFGKGKVGTEVDAGGVGEVEIEIESGG